MISGWHFTPIRPQVGPRSSPSGACRTTFSRVLVLPRTKVPTRTCWMQGEVLCTPTFLETTSWLFKRIGSITAWVSLPRGSSTWYRTLPRRRSTWTKLQRPWRSRRGESTTSPTSSKASGSSKRLLRTKSDGREIRAWSSIPWSFVSFAGSSSLAWLGLNLRLGRIHSGRILEPRINLKKSYPGTSLIRSHLRPRIFGKSATSSSASARKRSSSTISSGRCRATWCLSPRPKTTMSMPISLSTMCSASIKIISNHHRPQQGKYKIILESIKIRSHQVIQG